MQVVPTQALPIQKFSVLLDNNEWDITLRLTIETISATLSLNGTIVLENTRVVAGYKIIPYKYEENGNFVLLTQNYEIPNYTKFGVTQALVYISPDELEVVRSFDPTYITAADFDPNGALPLRFAPQGYTLE